MADVMNDVISLKQEIIEKNKQLMEKNYRLMWYNTLITDLIKCVNDHKEDLYHKNNQFLIKFNNIINNAINKVNAKDENNARLD